MSEDEHLNDVIDVLVDWSYAYSIARDLRQAYEFLLLGQFPFNHFPVFIETALYAAHRPSGADPEFLAHGFHETLVVTDEDHAALEGLETSANRL